jgi:hypothetical protein
MIGLITSRLSKVPSENVWKISMRRGASVECKGPSGLAPAKTRTVRAGTFAGPPDEALMIVLSKLPQLHEDSAAFLRSPRVPRPWRVTDVGACGKIPRLILESAFQDEELLATGMAVMRKTPGASLTCSR